MPARRALLPAATVAALLGVLLVACSGATPEPVPSVSVPLADAVVSSVTVEVGQGRTDRVARVVDLNVTNDGPTALTVVEGRLGGDFLDGDGVTLHGRDVPAGATRRLRAALPEPRCEGAPTTPDDLGAVVELDVTTPDGASGTVQVVPSDDGDDLLRIHGEDCAAHAVAAGLEISLVDALATGTLDGVPVADLVLRVRAVPGGPPVQLTQVTGTTLLRAPDAEPWDLDVDSTALGADPVDVVLPVVPARCDLHAIAEDKRGTVFGVRAVVDGVEQPVVYVASSPDLLGALHRFVVETCGEPTDARG